MLARWLFGVLVNSIQREQKRSGWNGRGEASSFRSGAATTLQHRMRDMADERRKMYQQAQASSGSRALMVVDRKAIAIAERFGKQKTRSTYTVQNGALIAGREAGQRINIPAGRPLSGDSRRLLGQ